VTATSTSSAAPQARSGAKRGVTRCLSATLAASLFLELGCPGAVRVARAEGPAPSAPSPSTPPPSTQTVEQLASQAYQQTAAGKYADAIASYMKAYEISKAGAILYNIATICDRKLHERTLAMEYFRRYLQAPDAEPDFARKATERLSVLKAEAAADEKARASAPMPAPPLSPAAQPAPPSHDETTPSSTDRGAGSGSGMLVAGIVVGAVGLLSVGGGLGAGAVAKSKYDNTYCTATSCSSSQGVSADQQAITFATVSTVAVIAGAVFIAAGIPLLIVGSHRTKTQVGSSIMLSPDVTRTGGGLGLQGTF